MQFDEAVELDSAFGKISVIYVPESQEPVIYNFGLAPGKPSGSTFKNQFSQRQRKLIKPQISFCGTAERAI